MLIILFIFVPITWTFTYISFSKSFCPFS